MRKGKHEICMRCNIFHVSCMGEKFAWAARRDGARKLDCARRVFEPDNIPSPLQVDGFGSLYRAKIRGGMENLTAFVEAIVQSSDDVYAAALKKNPALMEDYYRKKHMKFARQHG